MEDRIKSIPRPVYEIYSDVMEFLNQEDEKVAELKKKIFGSHSFTLNDDRYDEIGMLIELGIDITHWKEYPIKDQAKIRARYYLSNMVQVINAYYDERDRMIEKAQKAFNT